MRAVALGDDRRLGGYALAGADVVSVGDAGEAVAAWEALPDDVALVVLTPEVGAALAGRFAERPSLLRAVIPA